MAFDLCAFYMAQIGEAVKMLTDDTKKSLKYLDVDGLKLFRNMIGHTYEKVNKAYLKAYILNMVSASTQQEIKDRIKYCNQNADMDAEDNGDWEMSSQEIKWNWKQHLFMRCLEGQRMNK